MDARQYEADGKQSKRWNVSGPERSSEEGGAVAHLRKPMCKYIHSTCTMILDRRMAVEEVTA